MNIPPLLSIRVERRRVSTDKASLIVRVAAARAVDRNRARRRIRAVMKEHRSELRGFRVSVTFHRSAANLSFQELRAAADNLLAEALSRQFSAKRSSPR